MENKTARELDTHHLWTDFAPAHTSHTFTRRALAKFASLVTLGCLVTLHVLCFLGTHWSVTFRVFASYLASSDISAATFVLARTHACPPHTAPREPFFLATVLICEAQRASPSRVLPSQSRAAGVERLLPAWPARTRAPHTLPPRQVTPARDRPSSKMLLVPLERRRAAAGDAAAAGDRAAEEVSFEVSRRCFVWDGGERCFRKVAFETKETFGCAAAPPRAPSLPRGMLSCILSASVPLTACARFLLAHFLLPAST